ncbi:MAG: hypothetical protein AAF960_26565 [Bacteroidota bacterium]
MKVKIRWQVLKVLLDLMKEKYEQSNLFQPSPTNSVTDYFFLADRKQAPHSNHSTIGWALQQTFLDANIAEKSVYNYLHIPVTKQRDQFFLLDKKYPKLFFQYVGFKNFRAFLDWCAENGKLPKAIIEEQTSYLEEHQEQQNQYFYCYFPIQNKVTKAIGTFTNWKTLHLRYLDQYNEEIHLKGKVESKKKQFCITLYKDHTIDLKQDRSITFISLATRNSGPVPFRTIGTYAGVNNLGYPIAGEIIFEKISESVAKTSSPHIGVCAYPSLVNKNIVIERPDNSQPQPSIFPNYRRQQLKKLSGIYIGYIYVLKDNQPTFVEAMTIFRPDGTADCKGYSNIFYSGQLQLFSGGAYAKLVTTTDDDAHHFTYLFELKYQNDQVVNLEGFYVGSYKNKLVSGKEYLHRIANYSVENELKMEQDLREYTYTELFNEQPELASKLKSFLINPKKLKLLSRLNQPVIDERQQKRLAGTYWMYFYSSTRDIRQYVLKIDKTSNRAYLKTNNNQQFQGIFYLKDHFLFVRLESLLDSSEYLIQLLAYVGAPNQQKSVHSVEGIVTGLSNDDRTQRPVSLKTVLIKSKQLFESIACEQIPLASKRFALLNQNKNFPDLGYYLAGSRNNLLETRKGINLKEWKTQKTTDILARPFPNHARAMFKAACFTASEIRPYLTQPEKSEETVLNELAKEFLSQIQEACHHGFGYLEEDRIYFEKQIKTTLSPFASIFRFQDDWLQLDLYQFFRILPAFTTQSPVPTQEFFS